MCVNYLSFNYNFVNFFLVDTCIWLQIPKGVIFINRRSLLQRIEKCCRPFCELLFSMA